MNDCKIELHNYTTPVQCLSLFFIESNSHILLGYINAKHQNKLKWNILFYFSTKYATKMQIQTDCHVMRQ